MNKIFIFDPSYGTLNLGDKIIVDSTLNELEEITKHSFLIRASSHTPLFHFHQVFGNNIYKKQLKESKFKFILGSNLLFKDVLLTRKRPWNIHYLTTPYVKDVVLVGVGSNGNIKKSTFYTRQLYKRVLSKDKIHSVRDQQTYDFVKSLGLKVINTGCATMWSLTKEHCDEINTSKSKDVVFTLTDYAPNIALDKKLVEILLDSYDKVYFWPQGSEDANYFKQINISNSRIIELDPNINDYSSVLSGGNIDYVGSRLHGGIYALQHKVRTIIVAVDHRALNKKIDYNLPVIKRENIEAELTDFINSSFKTEILIDENKISEWKSQFI